MTKAHEQPAVGLDPDDHLFGLLVVGDEDPVELRHPFDAIARPASSGLRPVRVDHADVVAALGPIDPDEDHFPCSFPSASSSPEECTAP